MMSRPTIGSASWTSRTATWRDAEKGRRPELRSADAETRTTSFRANRGWVNARPPVFAVDYLERDQTRLMGIANGHLVANSQADARNQCVVIIVLTKNLADGS